MFYVFDSMSDEIGYKPNIIQIIYYFLSFSIDNMEYFYYLLTFG